MGGPRLARPDFPVGLEMEGKFVSEKRMDVHEINPQSPQDGGYTATHGDVDLILDHRLLQFGSHGDWLARFLVLVLLTVDHDPPYYNPSDHREDQHPG